MPELMYVSNSAILNWKRFAKEVVQNNSTYYGVVCEITAEVIKGKKYTWSKPKFAIARTLNEAEAAHILTMRELVAGRVTEYEDNAELDKYEEEALSVDRSKPVDSVDANAKSRTAEVEEDEAPVVSAKTEKAKKETAKPKETEEVEEKPKPAPKPAKDESAEDDGKEDEDKPKSAGRAGYPNLDDPDGDED
jgi:outer membrane biosynthesis protein TonB